MTRNLKYLSFVFFIWIVFSGCKKENFEIFEEPKTLLNVAYGSDAAQKADIFLPANRSQADTRVVLIIHGGGWMAGDKKDMESYIPKLQSQLKDYAVVNMNYRLASISPIRYMLPTQSDDIRSLMNYVQSNADEFGVKPEFVVLGYSAGGHLAMLYAYRYDTDKRVKAVVNIAGPCNLDDSAYHSNPIFSFGMNYITNPDNLPDGMTQAVFGSPVTWISTKSQPTIAFYGSSDDLIPVSQHTKLEQSLNNVEVYNEKHIYDTGHDVSFKFADDIIQKTKAFLSKHVR